MKQIALLGSTGSIGTQTLDLVRRLPGRLKVVALAANSSLDQLLQQAEEFDASAVAVCSERLRGSLEGRLPANAGRYYGRDGLEQLAVRPDVDTVVVAVSGAAATQATIAALEAGKDVALATKEVLVSAGEIVMAAARRGSGKILPIDSEHCGVFQCLHDEQIESVEKIWLTASGGPFREWTKSQLSEATLADALRHPTWKMGNKITIDSATLMNKGLETIEARWLFDIPMSQIGVVIHPQSTVHAMVAYRDGSILAQLGLPDMRTPIEYALLYPERIDAGIPHLSPLDLTRLDFEAPDEERFPSLRLAREASEIGGTMPSVMNGANETAVKQFLEQRIAFTQIAERVEQAMRAHTTCMDMSLAAVLEADAWGRRFVDEGTLL